MTSSELLRGLASFLCGVLVLAMLFAGLFGADGVRRHRRLSEELSVQAARQRALQTETSRLEAELWAMRYDRDYAEWLVRQELGWVKKGERILYLEQ